MFTGNAMIEEKEEKKEEKQKRRERGRKAKMSNFEFHTVLFEQRNYNFSCQIGWLTYSSQLLLKLAAYQEYLGNSVESIGPWVPKPISYPHFPL